MESNGTALHKATQVEDLPLWLTVKEVQSVLRLGKVTVLDLLNNNKLPGQRVGRQWRISRNALATFMEGTSWAK